MSDAFIVRRGGGLLSRNSAALHVTAPAGSTVTLAKGGVTVKVLGASKSIVDGVDANTAHWYYSISPGNSGSWTVSAALGGKTASKTLTIDSNKVYDVRLEYTLYLFKEGSGLNSDYSYVHSDTEDQNDRVTTASLDTLTIRRAGGSYTYLTFTPAIDTSKYDQMCIEAATTSIAQYGGYSEGLVTSSQLSNAADTGNFLTFKDLSNNAGRALYTLDISNYSDLYYASVRCAKGTLTIYNFYLLPRSAP